MADISPQQQQQPQQSGMSLRELYRYLRQRSQTYIVRDGRQVLVRWRRGDEIHGHAMQYLRNHGLGSSNLATKAMQACQDLLELRLLRCQENNQPTK